MESSLYYKIPIILYIIKCIYYHHSWIRIFEVHSWCLHSVGILVAFHKAQRSPLLPHALVSFPWPHVSFYTVILPFSLSFLHVTSCQLYWKSPVSKMNSSVYKIYWKTKQNNLRRIFSDNLICSWSNLQTGICLMRASGKDREAAGREEVGGGGLYSLGILHHVAHSMRWCEALWAAGEL